MAGRDALVLGRHVEGLVELQDLRQAMESDGPFADQLSRVFDAAVAYFRVEQMLRALLLVDSALMAAHRQMAAATGLGPQLPVDEVADWLRSRRESDLIEADVDVKAAALLLCGSADYIATLDLTVAAPIAATSYGGRDRILATLATALGARRTARTLID